MKTRALGSSRLEHDMPSPIHRIVRTLAESQMLGRLLERLPEEAREALSHFGTDAKPTLFRSGPLSVGEVAAGVGVFVGEVGRGATVRGVNLMKGRVVGGTVRGCNVSAVDVMDGDLRGINLLFGDIHGGEAHGINIVAGDVHGGLLRGANVLLGSLRDGVVADVNIVLGNVHGGRLETHVLVGDVLGGEVSAKIHVGSVIGGSIEAEHRYDSAGIPR